MSQNNSRVPLGVTPKQTPPKNPKQIAGQKFRVTNNHNSSLVEWGVHMGVCGVCVRVSWELWWSCVLNGGTLTSVSVPLHPHSRIPAPARAPGSLQHRVPDAPAVGQPGCRQQPGQTLREVRQGSYRLEPQAGACSPIQRALTPRIPGWGHQRGTHMPSFLIRTL